MVMIVVVMRIVIMSVVVLATGTGRRRDHRFGMPPMAATGPVVLP
ncbi:MAG: hypothetical protein AB1586_18470 [Pseudomonadota bacterium]|jgi:hypothetical protein